jgi:hypothetical protein
MFRDEQVAEAFLVLRLSRGGEQSNAWVSLGTVQQGSRRARGEGVVVWGTVR